MRELTLPFIENRSYTLGVTTFISLILHGLLLGAFSLANLLPTVKKQEDTGISIDLAIIISPAPRSALLSGAETQVSNAESVQQKWSGPEPMQEKLPQTDPLSKPEPSSVKKAKRSVKKAVTKPAPDSARREGISADVQKGTPLTNVSLATADGETTAPVPAGGSNTPSPPYPELARRRGQEGTVNVRCLVDSTGRVTGVSLAKSSGHTLLDEAALKTVRKWKFKPGKKGGVNAADTVIVPIRFKLQ